MKQRTYKDGEVSLRGNHRPRQPLYSVVLSCQNLNQQRVRLQDVSPEISLSLVSLCQPFTAHHMFRVPAPTDFGAYLFVTSLPSCSIIKFHSQLTLHRGIDRPVADLVALVDLAGHIRLAADLTVGTTTAEATADPGLQ